MSHVMSDETSGSPHQKSSCCRKRTFYSGVALHISREACPRRTLPIVAPGMDILRCSRLCSPFDGRLDSRRSGNRLGRSRPSFASPARGISNTATTLFFAYHRPISSKSGMRATRARRGTGVFQLRSLRELDHTLKRQCSSYFRDRLAALSTYTPNTYLILDDSTMVDIVDASVSKRHDSGDWSGGLMLTDIVSLTEKMLRSVRVHVTITKVLTPLGCQ